MKFLFLFLLSFPAFAKECALYELQGEVIKRELNIILVVNKDTNSQREFIFSRKLSLEILPYTEKTVRGKFITSKLEILKIEEVNLAIPDPLYRFNEMEKAKSVLCPK